MLCVFRLIAMLTESGDESLRSLSPLNMSPMEKMLKDSSDDGDIKTPRIREVKRASTHVSQSAPNTSDQPKSESFDAGRVVENGVTFERGSKWK